MSALVKQPKPRHAVFQTDVQRMDDTELLRFGMHARQNCLSARKENKTVDAEEVERWWEARTEWRKRHLRDSLKESI